MTARTAYGLDTPRGMHWADLAACSRATNPGVDPEWWWPTPANHVVSANTLRALHVCRQHCPVQTACHGELCRQDRGSGWVAVHRIGDEESSSKEPDAD